MGQIFSGGQQGLGEFSRVQPVDERLIFQARIMTDVPAKNCFTMFPNSWGAANLELSSGISLLVGKNLAFTKLAKPSFLRRRPTKEHFFASTLW